MSRRGTEWTAEFPELVESAQQLAARDAVIDGEIVVLSASGISSFEALQNRRVDRASLAYFAFDLLSLDGRDVSRQPLIERKGLLRELVGAGVGIIRYTEHFEEEGKHVLRHACQLGAEGIVSKRRDAPYRWGARHADWQKSKCSKRQEFVVGGFTDPSGSRVGVGSILVGYYEGDALRFAGKVGTGRGWSAAFGRELREKLERIATSKSPFTPAPPGWLGRNAHWARPRYVVEVEFTEWTAGGHIRHPSLQGFRRDKTPREVVKEMPAAVTAAKGRSTVVRSPAVFKTANVTRDELCEIYRSIARFVLPFSTRRPLTIVRCRGVISKADALRSQCAFVRHTAKDNGWAPASVPRTRIQEKKKVGEYLYVESIDDLCGLIEGGAIEWHTWNARVDDVEHPDRIVFDLDPGDGATWSEVVDAARRVRDVLRKLDLDSWPKTTGGRGLHVVVPFVAERSWDDVFAFSRAVAEVVVAARPEAYTLSFSKTDRRGKVLIDYKRNYRTSIAVAPYSMRARPSGTVSVPVTWREVTDRLNSDEFTITALRKRLARFEKNGRDPWDGFLDCRQRLPRQTAAG